MGYTIFRHTHIPLHSSHSRAMNGYMIYTELLLSSRMIQFQPLNVFFSIPICISKIFQDSPRIKMGVSENSVPHCTQWLMIIIPIKWLFHWEYTLFSNKLRFLLGAQQIPPEVRREGLQDAPRSACVPGSGAGMRCGNLDTSDTASLCLGYLGSHLAWLEPFSKIHIVIYYIIMI